MTQRQFEKEIRRLVRRAELLQRVAKGDAKLRKVPVSGHWVKRHYVDDYERHIEDRRSA